MGPFPTFEIIEHIMITIGFGRWEVTAPSLHLTNHSKHYHNHSFLGRLEVTGLPLTPYPIIFQFQEIFYCDLQFLVIPRFKNVSKYFHVSGTFADDCRVVQLYQDPGTSTRHKILAQVPGTRSSPPPRHKVRDPPWHKVRDPPGTSLAQGFVGPSPGRKPVRAQPYMYGGYDIHCFLIIV